ncbi:hypothetical protein RRG08_019530 [Elysia crispata]|uniref:Uncharacterized protein n=1 Tax=Elysia crispata TaxID=231223 RepID=A0AAE0YXB0_9GAST|nr:hypothetical protein RRG08_019530 [Elysia crispata]
MLRYLEWREEKERSKPVKKKLPLVLRILKKALTADFLQLREMLANFASALVLDHLLLVWTSGSSLVQAENLDKCVSYKSKLTSIPDLTHNIVYQSRREAGYVIHNVQSTEFERSYYWCELDVSQKGGVYKKYRHFGFNSTHWWVEKGCGGWFIITECIPLPADSATLSPPASGGKTKVFEYNILTNLSTRSEGLYSEDQNDPYRKWPRIGFMSPHSDVMWELLDRATHVDVPDQLGFYKKRRQPRSAAFNGLDWN